MKHIILVLNFCTRIVNMLKTYFLGMCSIFSWNKKLKKCVSF